MATSTLFWTLTAIVVIACTAYAFISKAIKASEGHKLVIDGDNVAVSDDEMQDFLFEVEEKAAAEINNVKFEKNNAASEHHAVA